MTKKKLAEMKVANEDNESAVDSGFSMSPDYTHANESAGQADYGFTNVTTTGSVDVARFSSASSALNTIDVMSINAAKDLALAQNARQHADEFFPFQDPDSANDLTVDYQDANYNRQFDLPVNDGQLERFAIDLDAYHQVFGQHMPAARDYAVIESSFGQSVLREQDADINFLASWLNLEETETINLPHSLNNSPVVVRSSPAAGVDTSATSSILSSVKCWDTEVMQDFGIPICLTPAQATVQQASDNQLFVAARLRRERLHTEYNLANQVTVEHCRDQ
jgi:hypothetical protein